MVGVALVLWVGAGFLVWRCLCVMLMWVGWWSVLGGFWGVVACVLGAGSRFPARCLLVLMVGLYAFLLC